MPLSLSVQAIAFSVLLDVLFPFPFGPLIPAPFFPVHCHCPIVVFLIGTGSRSSFFPFKRFLV